jgi:Holliday junction resolvase RusA-like endonuclease
MSDSITLTVPGVPVAQPRQRFTRGGINYTPAQHPANAWKAALAFAWHNTSSSRLDGPLALSVEFVMPRTTARPKKVPKVLWGSGRVPSPSRPDLDNLVKAVKDALNKLAYDDDGQVAVLYAVKSYAATNEQPHATITLRPLHNGSPNATEAQTNEMEAE